MTVAEKKANIASLSKVANSPIMLPAVKEKAREAMRKLQQDVDDFEKAEREHKAEQKKSKAPPVPKKVKAKLPTKSGRSAKPVLNAGILDEICKLEDEVWTEMKVTSASDIRDSKTKTAKYADKMEAKLKAAKINKHSLTDRQYDELVEDNYHILNEFLVWNGYYKNATVLQSGYLKSFNKGSNHTADPHTISIENRSKEPTEGESLLAKIKKDPAFKNIDFSSTSIEIDAKRSARPRGKRTSASGKTYTENRENRSDHKQSGPIRLDYGGLILEDGSLQTFKNYYLENGGEIFSEENEDLYGQEKYRQEYALATDKLESEFGKERVSGGADWSVRTWDVNHSENYGYFICDDEIGNLELVFRNPNQDEYPDQEMVVVKTLPYSEVDDLIEFAKKYKRENDRPSAEFFKKGGATRSKAAHNRDHNYVNKSEKYETDYDKDNTRKHYKKRSWKKENPQENPLVVAKRIRKEGESWPDARKRAFELLKKK